MRKYTAKNEKDLVKQIENNSQIDEEWGEPVKGHVVEMKYEEEM